MTDPTAHDRPAEESHKTGLPLFTSWPAVYIFVLAVFVLIVVLLTLFTRAYT